MNETTLESLPDQASDTPQFLWYDWPGNNQFFFSGYLLYIIKESV